MDVAYPQTLSLREANIIEANTGIEVALAVDRQHLACAAVVRFKVVFRKGVADLRVKEAD
jgi:hypothetical protein